MSLNLPTSGQISYNGNAPGTTYGPTTEKATHFQKFLTLANQHSANVTYEVVGHSSHSSQWDEVIFKIGNPNGGVVYWDCCIHGNEEMTTEAMYATMSWLLTPNSNPTHEARRTRILNNNLVIFFPFVNWRFSRMNYNYSATTCTGTDTNGDGGALGVNLARDFHTGKQQACPDNWAPTTSLSQPETQAMVYVMNKYGKGPTGWCYVNWHMGTTSKPSAGVDATAVESSRATIFTELWGGSKTWAISGSGSGSRAYGEAIQYYGARMACELECGSWTRTDKVTDFRTGATFKEVVSLLVAQAQLVEVTGTVTYTLTTNYVDNTTGTAIASPTTQSLPAGSYSVTAPAINGYAFTQWEDGSTANPRNITLSSNRTITARYTQSVSGYTLTTSVAAGSGTITPATGQYSGTVNVVATPASGYILSRLVVNGVSEYFWSMAPVTRPVVMTANTTVEARFYRPQVTITAMANGTTSPAPAVVTVNAGDVYTIQAVPNSGYKFSHWRTRNLDLQSDWVTDTVYPFSKPITNSIAVEANFVADTAGTFTVTIDSSPSGVSMALTEVN